jgi:hypothetical protein
LRAIRLLVAVLVGLGLPRVGVRVLERVFLAIVLFLLDTAVSVLAWILLAFGCGHGGLRS